MLIFLTGIGYSFSVFVNVNCILSNHQFLIIHKVYYQCYFQSSLKKRGPVLVYFRNSMSLVRSCWALHLPCYIIIFLIILTNYNNFSKVKIYNLFCIFQNYYWSFIAPIQFPVFPKKLFFLLVLYLK